MLSGYEMASGKAGVTEVDRIPSKETSVYPPVPPEILAAWERSYREAKG